MSRFLQATPEARSLLARGQAQYAAGDFEDAIETMKAAIRALDCKKASRLCEVMRFDEIWRSLNIQHDKESSLDLQTLIMSST